MLRSWCCSKNTRPTEIGAAAAFEKYENSLGMQHRTLRYIHNGAKILCILTNLAYFQKTCFRAAFGGLCSPLGRGSVQKIQKFSWDATQNSSLYSQWSQFLYAVKKWSQLLSWVEFKIRIVEEFIAPTVCANPIMVICPVMPTVTTPYYQNGGRTYHGALEYLKNSAAVYFPAKLWMSKHEMMMFSMLFFKIFWWDLSIPF